MRATLASTLVLLAASSTAFAQVGVNGVIGSEWAGVTPQAVLYNSAAPIGNFGTPTNQSNTVAYNVYIRADANFVYGALQALPAGSGLDGWSTSQNFVNLYLGLNVVNTPGSRLGFELGNDRAFIPGVPGYATGGLVANYGFSYVMSPGQNYGGSGAGPDGSEGAVAEFAIPWAYLETLGTNPSSLGFASGTFPTVVRTDDTTNAIRFNLSQSFGLSVAGGNASYGYTRLGVIPEPATVVAGIAAAGLVGGVFFRRRRAGAAPTPR